MENLKSYHLKIKIIPSKNQNLLLCWLNPQLIFPSDLKSITNKKMYLSFNKNTLKMTLISISSNNTIFIKSLDPLSDNLTISKKYKTYKSNGDKNKNNNNMIGTNFSKWYKPKLEKIKKNKKSPASSHHLIKSKTQSKHLTSWILEKKLKITDLPQKKINKPKIKINQCLT